MRLSPAFVALLAAVPSLASAIPSPRVGTVIPLTKRGNKLVDDQGVVNAAALRGQVRNAVSKVNRGFEAYQKNTGQVHPSQKQAIQPRATGADPLTDDDQELWQGTISVGSPASSFTVDFDTGSSDLFLPGPNCGSTCSGHRIYNPTSSSASDDQGSRFSLAFGDGSTVQGELFTDDVTVAGLTATNQAVGAATQYSTGFEASEFPPDGLLGMGFPQISVFGANPYFQTLVAQGVPTAAQFSFKLATSGSELFLGGADSSKFTGSFTNVPLSQVGFWELNAGSINVNGKAVLSNLDSIIDTGTTLIVAPQNQVAQFYRSVPGSADASNTIGEGFFTFPCNQAPSVSVTLGGRAFTLAADTFNLGQVSAGSSQCVGAVTGTTGIDFWVLGDVFLTNVYTRFDVGNHQVGFATLA